MFSFSSLKRLFRRKRKAIQTLTETKNQCLRLLNAKGIALTALKVYGFIEIRGRKYEARSIKNVYIKKGTPIKVIGREGYAYLVEPTEM